ncbi:NADPH-dependent FMN reductase [Streptomyces sp. NPDC004609]|uniref:NADPH-dependent FMN reductase n=1 Tax=Streptomyces sp. NPDC004609 TaxID=3364704 RepID=UPI0036B0B2E6
MSIVTAAPADHASDARQAPYIVGIGGTLRPHSTSETALRHALATAERLGASTEMITAQSLNFPIYDPENPSSDDIAAHLLAAVRRADGLIIASPGYHGNVSGLIKNAMDYLQGLASDRTPYAHNRAVGCIVTAAGWQAGAATLTSLRSTVHALRGWPTPLGVVINSVDKPFDKDGAVCDLKVGAQLATVGEQVHAFASSYPRVA